jgi:major intracellular serine protease
MSLGGAGDDPKLHDAVKYAVSKGIVVVCAAGNNGDGLTDTNEFAYPSAYPEVISVGAIDSDLKLANFSNTNAEIDVVAAGVNVLSTLPNGKYGTMSGTSMSCPHVTGTIALLISMYEKRLNKTLTVDEIRQLLKEHCKDIGISKTGEGNGLVDLSIGYTLPPKEEIPQPTPTPQKLYRVQVGAYSVRENADIMLKKIKNLGFVDAFIKYE